MITPIRDLLFGKKQTKQFDLERATATAVDEDGNAFTFEFTGRMEVYGYWQGYGYHLEKGSERLREYLSDSRLQVLIDNTDKAVPVCRIKKIKIKVKPLLKTFTFRDG